MYVTNIWYRDGDVELSGIHVTGDRTLRGLPAVVIFHDARGPALSPRLHIERMVRAGFGVLVADMFGVVNKPSSLEQGIEAVGAIVSDKALWRRRALAALDAARSLPGIDAECMSAVGYCFGGATALELALAGTPLRAFVSIHGGLDRLSLESAENVKAPVLVCTGANDPLIPPEQIASFQRAFREKDVMDWQVLTLGRAKHSFTYPDAPNSDATGYHVLADRRALRATLSLLVESRGRA